MKALPKILLALTAVAALSVAYPAKANLITNPGFETGNFTGWTVVGSGAYPEVLAHTDLQFELLEALKKVKALCRDDLTQEERRLVTQAHDFFEERLRIRVI